uniref:Type I secretion outer membrane protein, TolC n=1 Tax=Chlorobium chlorochromatii (strain CaD3) TaxID=340177 RepID=Q3ASL2_CHLCH
MRCHLKKIASLLLLLVLSVSAFPLHAETLDLATAYRKAMEYDARLRAAKADNAIYREEVGKARSQLRPNIRGNASRGRSTTQRGNKYGFYPADSYNTVNYGVTFRQTIFNFSSTAAYDQAKLVAMKSDTDFRKEEEMVMVRIAEAYCNVLFAEDNLAFNNSFKTAAKEQLQQAKKRFAKGVGTLIEVEEAQASYDQADAQGIDMQNNLEFSRRELEHLTGIYPSELRAVDAAKLPLFAQQESFEVWLERARTANASVESARHEILIAKKEAAKQRGAQYPSLELVAGRNYSESENNYSIGAIYNTYSVSMQLSWPIYTGGYGSSSIRQADAKKIKAEEQYSLQVRQMESDVRKYYNSVAGSIALVKAYQQAVNSREVALKGMKRGFQAGLRSNVEVLDAEQKLFASRRDLAKSRYQYILNLLMLKQAAGVLQPQDVDEVNGWFAKASLK